MNGIPGLEQCARALLCALVFALTSCGGSDDVAPPANQVGPAGGTVTGPNGTQVVVPAGALSAPMVITFTPTTTAPPMPAGLQVLGTIYDIGPSGTTFTAPVTVTLPLDPAQVPAGARLRMLHGTSPNAWEELPGLVVGTTSASAQTTSFTPFAMALGNSPPVVTAQPVAQAVMAPMGASFSVSFTGTPPFNVQWERSNDGGTMWANAAASQNVIASPGTSTLTLASTSALAAATGGDNGALFRAAIRNIETPVLVPVLSSVVTLTVTAVVDPPTITTQPQSVSGAIGNASFSVVATGTNLVYQWFKNGAPIAGATNASLNLVNVQAADAGNYTVVVSNLVNGAPVNSVTSNVATLTLTTPPPATSVARIAAGNNTSSAVTASGVLYTWGTYRGAGAPNTSGSTAAPIALAGVRTVARGSSTHGVAVRTDATVWAWGYSGDVFCNFTGGTIYHTPTQVPGAANIASASAGTGHTLLLSNTGVVSAFGCNGSGQLGQSGSIQSSATAVQVPGLPAGITAVAAGSYFSLALDGNGNVWAWGKFTNFNGTTLIDYGFTPVQIAGLTNVKVIAAGDNHALALKNDGSVSAWGNNSNGKLGDGTAVNRLTPVATLLTSGIKAVDASSEFSLALREADGVVLSWGINETGQLGSGSNSPGFRVTPAPVVGLSQVEAIAASKNFGGGLGHSLALRMDGTVWAWGWNMEGQLGNGNTNNSTTPVQVTGLNLN